VVVLATIDSLMSTPELIQAAPALSQAALTGDVAAAGAVGEVGVVEAEAYLGPVPVSVFL
jgi:hypothetical protein